MLNGYVAKIKRIENLNERVKSLIKGVLRKKISKIL